MQLPSPKISKKAWTVLSTLGIIGVVYIFYFFVYVSNNETAYQQKAFRILDKIGENIKDKHKNNKKNVNSIVKIVEEQGLLDLSDQPSLKVLEKKVKQLNAQKRYLNSLNKEMGFEDREKDFMRVHQSTDRIEKLMSEAKHEMGEKYHELYKEKLREHTINNGFSIFSIDTVYHSPDSLSVNDYSHLFYEEDVFQATEKKSWYLLFETSLNDFMKPLMREDVFDELMIIREGDEDITYQTFPNNVQLHQMDSLFQIQGGIKSSNTSKITVQEVTYKVFVYNLNFDKNEKWVIAGCIKEQRYLTEIRSISFWVIINSSLFVILLMVGMPILKLALMNSVERLHIRNVFLTGLSIVVGTPLIILSFLIAFNYYGYDFKKTDQSLQKLSNSVSTKFSDELESVYQQLSSYDDSLSYHINNGNLKRNTSVSDVLNDTLFAPKTYKNFNEVFWMDADGQQVLQLTPNKKANALILLQDRDYFQHVINDDLWKHPTTNETLYVQSITSWTTGKHEIAVSKKGEHPQYPVAAITARFRSVIDAIIPMGYGFSIISDNGEVLIHSESDKNLQENFLEECQRDVNLQSAIYSKIALKTTVDYLGREHRAYISPIKGMPLFLVVYFDLENLKARISEIWSTTVFIIMSSFVAVGMLILIIFITRFQQSKLQIKQFYFDWMIPHTKHIVKYKRLILSNLFIFLMVILFNRLSGNEQVDIIFRLFILPSIAFTLIHLQLNHFISQKMKRVFLVFSILYLIGINWFFGNFLGPWNEREIFINCLFQVVVIAAFLPYPKIDDWLSSLSFGTLRNTYSIFLLTWLLSSGIAPAVYLYKTAYAVESEIWTKYSLLDMSRNIEDRGLETGRLSTDTASYEGVYHNFLGVKFLSPISTGDSISVDSTSMSIAVKNNHLSEIDGFSKDTLNVAFDSLMFYLRPGYNNSIIENKGLVHSFASDGSFDWKEHNNNVLLTHQFADSKSSKVHLSSGVDKIYFLSYKGHQIYIFLLFFILGALLYFLYQIISFCVNKIYGVEFSDYVQKFSYDLELIKGIIANNNTILIGLPGSGKTALTKDLYKGVKDFLRIDCMMINHKETWEEITTELGKDKYKTIVFDNFEYNNDNHDTNSVKLKLLEQQLYKKKHIVLVSEVHPSEIMDFYVRTIAESSDQVPTREYENELEIWRHIFSSFIEAYKPLEITTPTCAHEVLANELKYGKYLQNLCEVIEKEIKPGMDREDIILEIQQYAKSYYYALWNALTKREKFAVYDLAKDRFMNTKNKPVINSLLKKGILCYDDSLHLMNESFTNFVLSVVKEHEVLEMNLEVSKKGKWINIRLAIVLTLIALIALMGFGQPSFFKNINTILIAVTGVASVVPMLSGLFSLTQKIK